MFNMDASYLPELCMKEISTFINNDRADLLKCSLINRHWNHYFIPELWKNPFTENSDSRINRKKLIETFLLCLSHNEKKSIQELTIDSNPYLMYSKYLQVLDLSKLVILIEENYPIKYHLQIYKLLCFHLISNSTNISMIIFSRKSAYNNNTDIFLYPNAKNLSKVKEIEFHGSLSGLIFNCYKICRDLQSITFCSSENLRELCLRELRVNNERYNGHKYLYLKNLIQSQKKLKNLNIHGFLTSENKYLYEAIKSQVSFLRCIKFESIEFNENCSLDCLIKCENLEELHILACNFYGNVITRENNDNYYNYYSSNCNKSKVGPKLKYLKFKNCVQADFLDNFSLIISLLGQNLQYLYIRGEVAVRGLRNINLLLMIAAKCENLEELRILGCSEFHENIITNKKHSIRNNNNFQINSRLKYLQFENCNQKHFLDNYSIISICGQNLQYLYIRGQEILAIPRNFSLLLAIATNCLNLKLFKLSIIEEDIKYIPTLFSSCQKLQHVTFNTYEQRELINIDLSMIGQTIPLSLRRFTMKMNLYFTPENFKDFLIISQDKINLEVLNFKKCKLFSNDHLDMLIKYRNGHLKKLKITNAMKVDPEGLLRASQFVKIEGPKFLEI